MDGEEGGQPGRPIAETGPHEGRESEEEGQGGGRKHAQPR